MSAERPTLVPKVIQCECAPGVTVAEAIGDAMDLALLRRCPVSFRHNCTTYTADPYAWAKLIAESEVAA